MHAFPDKLWPERSSRSVPPKVIRRCLLVAVVSAAVVGLDKPGSGLALASALVLLVALRSSSARPTRAQLLATGAALVLLALVAVRAAEWLDGLCLLGAVGLGTFVVGQGRSFSGLVAGVIAPLAVCAEVPFWVRNGMPRTRRLAWRARPAATAALTVVLVVVFGALFSAADPAYAAIVDGAVPRVALGSLTGRVFVFAATALAAVVATSLAVHTPQVEALRPGPARAVRRAEWLTPLLAVNAVFVSFVLVELTVLFGGDRHVLRTHGLTYARYARQGFWQLLAVTTLALVVVAAVVRWAPRANQADRLLLRVGLGVLCLTTLVVVASAVHRMSLYEQAFGYTRLRLVVTGVELVLGAVLALLLLAGIRVDGRWLPRATVGLLAVAFIGLGVMNPDAYVARHDVDRYLRTGHLDPAYLSQLSADAVPEIAKLPASQADCVLAVISARLDQVHDHWYDGNLARMQGRHLLAARRVTTSGCAGIQSRS